MNCQDFWVLRFSSVAQSCLTLCDPVGCSMPGFPIHHQLPRACSNSCPLSQRCRSTISSSVVPFCLQSFPASQSFLMNWLLASGDQSIGASASTSVLPMNIQDWFPLGLTSLISLWSKGLSRVFSNTTVQKHQFFSTQLSLLEIHKNAIVNSLFFLNIKRMYINWKD